jgi:DNA repair protein RecN (Recombination protein N)
MLKHLYIKHFTIIDEITVELNDGLTVLTGETGAGKSILIDALQMALGERAETSLIQTGQERCEVTAIFDVANNQPAQQWLQEQALDEGEECLVRRVISRNGPSRSTINGRPCSVQSLRELGTLLVHIHGQHQHQQLLKSDYQRQLLDEFAKQTALCNTVHDVYERWRQVQTELASLQNEDQTSQLEFLNFQINELEELALQPNELVELEAEQRQLSHAEQWIESCQQLVEVLSEDEQRSVLHGLYTAESLLKALPAEQQQTIAELLQQAQIQVSEAADQARHYLQGLEPDPQRLQWVDQRLARIHDMARKHRIKPEELLELQQTLVTKRQQLSHKDEHLAALQQQLTALATQYSKHAKQLTKARQQAADTLNKAVTAHIQTLGMPGGRIQIELSPRDSNTLHPYGNERVEFLISTNAGQPFGLLSKVASGGELSRVALAIQVIVAQATILPTLIFDEVDVGIGGGTAEIVGQQLKTLGKRAQVLCVTHLPQVAAQGMHHLLVEKRSDAQGVSTAIRALFQEEKISEIARMLGGVKITAKTLAHAREMVG